MNGVTDSTGRIHSVQSLGAADGPGVRAVVFMQGCPLRCACCHNPDTWDFSGGREIKAEELCTQLLRFAPYFGTDGGVTVSGGEPLCQADFVRRLFVQLHENGIHTALDTSGCLLTPAVDALLAETDLVLLDWKYTDDAAYRRYVGCGQAQVAAFLQRLQERQIPVWLRQVSIPGLNDTPENDRQLSALAAQYSCIRRIELLPFRKLCIAKYRALSLPFPLESTPEADTAETARRQAALAVCRD